MIKNSFIFLDGIAHETEKKLWKNGILTWNDFLNAKAIKGISKDRKKYLDFRLKEAKEALANEDSSYFADKFLPVDSWRLYDYFKDEAIFLDIEVSGVTEKDDVTVVGLFDGKDSKIMIKNINLDFTYLARELRKYKIIVTFNGSVFDIPFLKKRYPGLIPEIPIIDLRFVCSRLKFNGGLKEIEVKLGIVRQDFTTKFNSGNPHQLFRMFNGSKDEYYLQLLQEYNEEDVVNLKFIADMLISKMRNSLVI